MNTYPNSDTLGPRFEGQQGRDRGDVGALENYMKRDHEAQWKEWERRIAVMSEKVASIDGVRTESFLPEIANEVPHLRIQWDQDKVAIAPDALKQKLREGDPSIEVIPGGYVPESVEIASWMLQDGEAETIGDRIAEILREALTARGAAPHARHSRAPQEHRPLLYACSLLTAHGSLLTVHGSRFTVHGRMISAYR